ncbi:hypothetical protein GWG54_17730 [Natronococcus sp. JC468]|uniref:hypothetical protein n=1 Tax=Natronococcus sp. JC468 TaxID=1961921 RepID=UPI001439E57D|nr:hypothetical protein [Natronococcus sp. JC468]NKE37611.1 hypothetical protein [Natronococcus sp. JC468]
MNRQTATVVATLTVRVPLGASGSLVDGAARVVDRTGAVARLEELTVRTVAPGLNDTTVDCRVRFEPADDASDERVRARLEDGVGVLAVEAVDSVEGDPPVVDTDPVRTG